MTGDTKILVFARAPEAGRTKTRLVPRLGADGAAALHRQLIRHAVETAQAAELGPVELWCAPSTTHPFLAGLGADASIALREQPDGDLGARMHAALDDALATHPYALLIGTDCPDYSAGYLRAARDALASGNEAVIGPATDGGYVLIGLRRNDARLFSGIDWGSSSVAESTRDRLRQLGWSFSELETLRDIDRPEDITGVDLPMI